MAYANMAANKAADFGKSSVDIEGRAGGSLAEAGISPAKKRQDNKPKTVVFACDENYAPYLPVVLQSLIDHSSAAYGYEIVIMDCCADPQSEIFDEMRHNLQEMLTGKSNFSLKYIKLRAALEQNAFLRKNEPALKRYGYGTYARVFIPDLLADCEKALYLDIDHIILADIAALFALPLGDRLIAAVPDVNVAALRLQADSRRKQLVEQKLGLLPDNYYIVASPMLFNIQACRKFGFTEKILALLAQDYKLPFPDQDAINAVCKGQIFYLPQKWGRVNARNFAGLCDIIRKGGNSQQIATVLGDWRADSTDIAVIHYVTTPKPWGGVGPDYSGLWWHYATKTANGVALLFSLLFPLVAPGARGYFVKTYKLFGLPVLTIKTFPEKIYYQLGKFSFVKKIYGKENCYIYVFGIKIFTIHKKPAWES
ncbi:glycosyltransferase family 8 protein [Candidatus Tokpelaia sp.]|uniref:glycosyltransferase family 8 protein n=1 Tax=Candidatus Tokpelaia sp. TaxID=2233777 RepID=UPI001238B665|nr:glycosyltransferase family 8 protein [Candidatus Tokpelaia sp.]KAA6404753.1 hypothetical protein DPQ22_07435 [Candidatus Tokpelaia sp.]